MQKFQKALLNSPQTWTLASPANLAYSVTRGGWHPYAFHIKLNEIFLYAATHPGTRIILQASVGAGKTEYMGYYAPAWYMGMFPDQSFFYGTHTTPYATRMGQRVGSLLQANSALFGWGWSSRTKLAGKYFRTPFGGEYFAQGVAANVSGAHVNFMLIDDPFGRAEAANSIAKREAVWHWYDGDLSQRMKKGCSVIITSARWHNDDLIGRILRQPEHGYKVYSFPALSVDPVNDLLGRKVGMPLVPELMPQDELLRRKRKTSRYYFDALYQQTPGEQGGSLIKENWLKYHTQDGNTLHGDGGAVCDLDTAYWMIFTDTAKTVKASSDYTVAQVWVMDGNTHRERRFWLVDQIRRRMESPNIIGMLEALYRKHPRVARIGIEGKEVAQFARKAGLPAFELSTKGDKWVRALPLANLVEDGRVFLPKGADYTEQIVGEWLGFPIARYDDCFDASAHAIARGLKFSTGGWL